ncbi:LolA family protein [Qaidamihabitans albus]|uniref:LolA family protein n=1 Tax=Qaidamihabitans albus TaxID=2795733 RepID=UPI0018F23EA3|nr:outer membrane lipoprotein carrier protein LolA [Qaidamihabitans albus]
MNPKRKAVAVAAAGTALGVAGLGVIAMPAGADAAPELPPVSAEALVESVFSAESPALSGTIELDNGLGLPAIPGAPALDMDSARVHNDGEGRSRLAMQDGGTERTIVHDGATVWNYDSASNTATKTTLPAEAATGHGMTGDGQVTDPTSAAKDVLQAVRQSSTVTVDGTARVADRAAYELVLTPKPTERTLLREVRVAVDSETRLPLRLAVLTHGTTEPALQVGFSDVEFGPQPAGLFRFTPPPGATVEERQADQGREHAPKTEAEPQFDAVGEGWDTVLVGEVPAELLTQQAPGSDDVNVRGLLGQIGKPVTGSFGSGHVISTNVGNALVTDDGRVAFGAVPEQVLIQTLGDR